MRITEKLLKAQPRPAGGQVLLWDDLVRGYGVRLTPTRVSHIVQWREAGDRKPRYGLGHWPAMSVDQGREAARLRLQEVAKASAKGGQMPLRQAMRQWEAHQTAAGAWRPRYAYKVDRIISLYVEGTESQHVALSVVARDAIAELGATPVGLVTRSQVTAVSDAIKQGIAEQVLAILSSFFNWAYDREWVQGNPARNRLRLTGGRRVRNTRLTDKQVVALARQFRAEGDPAGAAFELLLLTGARRREVTGMRWSELDLKAGTWTLPPERRKTGRKNPEPFTVTLAPQAVALIERQPRLEGVDFVFWGRRDRKAWDFQHLLLDRVHEAAGVEDWRLHDLRRYMRTGLAKLGVSQVVAEMCLGHMSPKSGLVGVYDQHDYSDEMKAAWLKWGRTVKKLLG